MNEVDGPPPGVPVARKLMTCEAKSAVKVIVCACHAPVAPCGSE